MKTLNDLGKKLVKCNLHCDGIKNNPTIGVIPRGLVLEERKGGRTCAVVGLNPGKCKKAERDYYLSKGIRYSSIVDYFMSNLRDGSYYGRNKEVINLLRFDGDILWTDLIKCECSGKNGTLPIQTIRVCVNTFLRQEIMLFKCSTIFALGNKAFNFCALSFPNHYVICVPHLNSRGDFSRLRNRIARNRRHFIQKIFDTKDIDGNYRAVKLKLLE